MFPKVLIIRVLTCDKQLLVDAVCKVSNENDVDVRDWKSSECASACEGLEIHHGCCVAAERQTDEAVFFSARHSDVLKKAHYFQSL